MRDALWRRLADGPAAPSTEDRALFAQLLDHADRLADGRSRDGERAARLQALQRSLAELDEDRAVLDMQRQALQRDLERQNRIWDETLAEAGVDAAGNARPGSVEVEAEAGASSEDEVSPWSWLNASRTLDG